MATRPNPYLKKDPGDLVLAADWNEMQVQSREELVSKLAAHGHSGGDDAGPIARAGIAPNAVDGTRIDPQSDVALKSLKVNGRVLLDEIDKLLASVAGLVTSKADRAGGAIAGPLSVQKDLQVAGNAGVAGSLKTGPLTVKGDLTVNGGTIRLGLDGNGGGQLVLTNNTNDNRIYLEAFNSKGDGSATEMLLTGFQAQAVPQLTFSASNTTAAGSLAVNGGLSVAGSVTVGGDLTLQGRISGAMRAGGVIVDPNLNDHIVTDGSFYRWGGQVYINVDDNLYIKDSIRGIRMHFDTVNGIFKTDKLRLGDKWLLSGVGDGQGSDDWLRLMNAGNAAVYYGGLAAGRLWTAQGVLAGSDLRLKHDIATIGNALAKVGALRGVTYFLNDAPGHGEQAGVVAQEVEAVFPQVVSDGPDGMKGVNYNGMIGLLVEAIKEQQTQIDTLRAETRSLRNLQ